MNKLFFITGASGSGKTTTIKNIQEDRTENLDFFFFDSIGVPTPEEMKNKFGSGEEWQRITTHNWVKKIKEETLTEKSALLDGQINPSFIDEACKENNLENYEVILFHCSDEKRSERLIERGHPELVNEDMNNWSKYLHEEAVKRGYKIINTTKLTPAESVNILKEIINN